MPARRVQQRRAGSRKASGRARRVSLRPREMHLGPSFNFSRSWLQARLNLALGGGATLGTITMGWSSMPSALQAFLTSFDLIRVKRVRVTFSPSWSMTPLGAASAELPTLALAANYDDNVVPTTYDSVTGTSNVRIHHQWSKPIHITVTPSFIQPVGISSAQNAVVVPVGAWVNPTTMFSAGVSVVSPMLKYGASGVNVAVGSGAFEVWLRIDFETVQAGTGGP